MLAFAFLLFLNYLIDKNAYYSHLYHSAIEFSLLIGEKVSIRFL